MTQNVFVSFSSIALSARGYWVERPSVFCWSTFPVLLLYACLFSDNVWLFLEDKNPPELGIHCDKMSQCSHRDGCLTKLWALLLNPLQIPVYPKDGCFLSHHIHGLYNSVCNSTICVCISHYLFNLLRDSRVLLQYSNPLYMQTKNWMMSLVLILKKMHHEVTLSFLMQTTRWGRASMCCWLELHSFTGLHYC